MNKRLNVMTTLGELLALHIADYDRSRAGRAPKLSIHGKQQNIKMQFQIHERVVGELVLYCPKNDPDPENYVGRFGDRDVVLPVEPDWAAKIRKLSHAKRSDQRDYWACIDILYMMAMQGFKVVTFEGGYSHIHAGGVLAPGGVAGYGRFAFRFNVTTGSDNNYLRYYAGDVVSKMPEQPDELKTPEQRHAELAEVLADPNMRVVRIAGEPHDGPVEIPSVEAINTIRGRESGVVILTDSDMVSPEHIAELKGMSIPLDPADPGLDVTYTVQTMATGGYYEGTKNEPN